MKRLAGAVALTLAALPAVACPAQASAPSTSASPRAYSEWTWRYDWTSKASYPRNSLVRYHGRVWLAQRRHGKGGKHPSSAKDGWSLVVTKGSKGATGPAGPQGPNGTNGTNGQQGPAGSNGAAGATGAMGPTGVAGPVGVPGPVGATGPMGPTGPIGPTGPAWPYGSFYQMGYSGLEVPKFTNFPISSTSYASDISLSGVDGVLVAQAGLYLVNFVANVKPKNSGNFSYLGLTVSDNLVPASKIYTYNSSQRTATYSGSLILNLAAGDILRLRNIDGANLVCDASTDVVCVQITMQQVGVATP